MEFLKRELAPVTSKVWNEIDNRARIVLKNNLTARKFIKVSESKGRIYEGVPTGHLNIKEKEGLYYGIYQILPLVETRINFTLDRWEIDNIDRGAKDINFASLDEAIKKAAIFEENAVYYGLDEACIEGLNKSKNPIYKFGESESEVLKSIVEAFYILKNNNIEGPCSLVLSKEKFGYLNIINQDGMLFENIEKIIGGPILISQNIKEGLLVPYNNDNLELVIGQDFSIGYHSSNDENIKFFITSSFTFRLIDKKAVVIFE